MGERSILLNKTEIYDVEMSLCDKEKESSKIFCMINEGWVF